VHVLRVVMGNVDDPRDLKTVEKDLSKSSDQKEAAYTDINKLNNEQKSLNEQISRITNQAATAERTAREKEDAFNRDQESTKRKDELNEELQRLLDQDKELEKQVRKTRRQTLARDHPKQLIISMHHLSRLHPCVRNFYRRSPIETACVISMLRRMECSVIG
jgi:chromosome segregation ATPase